MATITNRSNYVVSVPRRPELTSSFAYDAQPAITAYVKRLGEQGFKPVIKQLEDKMQVRIRRTGHYARNEARKYALDAARRRALAEGVPHAPFFEAFVQFQLATAARRGESLGLFWSQVNFKRHRGPLQ